MKYIRLSPAFWIYFIRRPGSDMIRGTECVLISLETAMAELCTFGTSWDPLISVLVLMLPVRWSMSRRAASVEDDVGTLRDQQTVIPHRSSHNTQRPPTVCSYGRKHDIRDTIVGQWSLLDQTSGGIFRIADIPFPRGYNESKIPISRSR